MHTKTDEASENVTGKNEMNRNSKDDDNQVDENNFKKKETQDAKMELCELSSEIKNVRNESLRKDKQISMLKDKLQDLNIEVSFFWL